MTQYALTLNSVYGPHCRRDSVYQQYQVNFITQC